jgi:hypothetical protein
LRDNRDNPDGETDHRHHYYRQNRADDLDLETPR